MKKIKLKESTEFMIAELLFYLLVIVMALLVLHRFTDLQQAKSADITAQIQNVNN